MNFIYVYICIFNFLFITALGAGIKVAGAGVTTYYVSNSYGNDQNDGLSPTAEGAWKTLEKVTNSAAAFSPGDSILLKRGDIWRCEQIALLSYQATSGTAGNPIKFGCYGTGTLPILSGAVSSSDLSAIWVLSASGVNEYYLSNAGDLIDPIRIYWSDRTEVKRQVGGSIGNLTDYRWEFGDNDGIGHNTIYIRSDFGMPGAIEIPQTPKGGGSNALFRLSGMSYITIQDVILEMTLDTGIYSYGSDNIIYQRVEARYGASLNFYGTENRDTFLVEDVESHHHTMDGLGISAAGNPPLKHVVVRNSLFHSNGGSEHSGAGIWTFNIDGAIIEKNTIFNNQKGGMRLDYWNPDNLPGELKRIGGFVNGTVRGNTVYNNGFDADGVGDGTGGIYIELGYNNLVIQNLVYGNYRSQIIADKLHSDNNTIAYNVVRDGLHQWDYSGIKVDSDVRDNKILNNVIDNCWDGITIGYNATGSIVKNNIVTNSVHTDLYLVGDFTQRITSDNNLFTGVGTNYVVSINKYPNTSHPLHSTKYDLADWQSLDYEGMQHDLNSLQLDPLYSDESGNDFSLQPSSPAINMGQDVGIKQDFIGTSVPQSNMPDIGAYEFITSSSSTSSSSSSSSSSDDSSLSSEPTSSSSFSSSSFIFVSKASTLTAISAKWGCIIQIFIFLLID